MANHILAVHLGAESVALAIAQSTLRSLRVQLLAVLDPSSAALSEIVGSRAWDTVIASIPGDAAAFRFLEFPFRDHRRLAQAVGPALEAHVPLSLDDAYVAWDVTSADRRGPVLATMIPRAAVARHRSRLEAIGVMPDRLVWEPASTLEIYRRAAPRTFTAIELGADSSFVACFVDGRLRGLRVCARADDETTVRNIGWFASTLEPPTARCLVGGPRADVLLPALRGAVPRLELETLPEDCPVDIAPNAAPAWRASTAVLSLVLTAVDAVPPRIEVAETSTSSALEETTSVMRAAAPWAAAAAALLLTAAGLDSARLYRRSQDLERTTTRIYRSVMPQGDEGPGQRIKMEARAGELERRLGASEGGAASVSPLGVLADMSAAVPADLPVEFDLYAYDPPAVRLRGRSQSFESVTRLQEILRASGRFAAVEVADVHAAVSEGVEFELTLRLPGEQPA